MQNEAVEANILLEDQIYGYGATAIDPAVDVDVLHPAYHERALGVQPSVSATASAVVDDNDNIKEVDQVAFASSSAVSRELSTLLCLCVIAMSLKLLV